MTIKSLDEIATLAKAGTLYVRYSRSHTADIRRGYSLDHSRMIREPGLSAQEITPADAEQRGWMARLLSEYRHITMSGGYGWIARGERTGTDSDGCPTIGSVQYIGRLDPELVERCAGYSAALAERDRTDRGAGDTRPWPQIADYGL